MGFLSWISGGDARNRRLANWAKKISIAEKQQDAMWELWLAGQNEIPPSVCPFANLNQADRDYILKICSADFRPVEFGDANVLRLAAFKHFKRVGFNPDQSAILVGMMFNMVGRKDL